MYVCMYVCICMYVYIYIFLYLQKNSIQDLMAFFRKNWPNQSITPKLHMLEDHATEFIKKWGYGLGLYGEQGGESIHPEFNNLAITYSSMKGTRRLHSMLKEHYLRVHPLAKKMKPSVITRKRKANSVDSS